MKKFKSLSINSEPDLEMPFFNDYLTTKVIFTYHNHTIYEVNKKGDSNMQVLKVYKLDAEIIDIERRVKDINPSLALDHPNICHYKECFYDLKQKCVALLYSSGYSGQLLSQLLKQKYSLRGLDSQGLHYYLTLLLEGANYLLEQNCYNVPNLSVDHIIINYNTTMIDYQGVVIEELLKQTQEEWAQRNQKSYLWKINIHEQLFKLIEQLKLKVVANQDEDQYLNVIDQIIALFKKEIESKDNELVSYENNYQQNQIQHVKQLFTQSLQILKNIEPINEISIALPQLAQLYFNIMLGNKDLIQKNVSKFFLHLNFQGYWNPAMVAIYYNQLEIVKCILNKQKGQLLQDNDSGDTPFSIALKCGHLQIIKFLIEEYKIKPKVNVNNQPPILIASSYGHLDVVKYLIDEQGVNPRISHNNFSPILFAAKNNHVELVRYFIEVVGIEMNSEEAGRTAFLMAAQENSMDVLRYLVEEVKVDPDYTVWDGSWTALQLATIRNRIEAIEYLVKIAKADVNKLTVSRLNPLIISTKHQKVNLCRYFVEECGEIDVNIVDDDFKSSKEIAIDLKDAKLVDYYDSVY